MTKFLALHVQYNNWSNLKPFLHKGTFLHLNIPGIWSIILQSSDRLNFTIKGLSSACQAGQWSIDSICFITHAHLSTLNSTTLIVSLDAEHSSVNSIRMHSTVYIYIITPTGFHCRSVYSTMDATLDHPS